MLRIKSFGAFGVFENNDPNVTSAIGELSVYSQTFASDVKKFKEAKLYPHSFLFNFSCLREISSTQVEKADLPEAVKLTTLQIMEDLVKLSLAGDLVDDKDALLTYLLNNYQGQIKNVEVGEIISAGGFYLPEYIYYEGFSTTSPYSHRLWMADGAFRRQYDLFEHRVVKIVNRLDDFFGTGAQVQALVDALDIREIQLLAATTANRQPPTEILTEYFDWVNPANAANKIPVPWTVVDYGEAGKNLDALKKSLADYILANSSFGESEWIKIFPDIFGATEFIIVPHWHHTAIPEDNLNGQLYYPGGKTTHLVEVIQKMTKGKNYTPAHIAAKNETFASVYKNVQLGIIGNPGNRDGVDMFSDQWNDYLAVTTQSIDFERMSDNTKVMVRALLTLLLTAETMTNQTDIPSGTMRATRDGILYITASVQRIQLVVVSKMSLLENFQPYRGAKK